MVHYPLQHQRFQNSISESGLIFLTSFQIYSFQDMLVAENPKLVSKMVIGQSYEGRLLNVLKVEGHFRKSSLFLNQTMTSNGKGNHTTNTFTVCALLCLSSSSAFCLYSSALVEATVLLSGSTPESMPESGSPLPVALCSPRRWFDTLPFTPQYLLPLSRKNKCCNIYLLLFVLRLWQNMEQTLLSLKSLTKWIFSWRWWSTQMDTTSPTLTWDGHS